jgi:hypothetical protein
MIAADLIEQARSADLSGTAQGLGANLRRVSAAEWAGPCIVCGGTDRFAVNAKKRLWSCRGCITGGSDAISLVMHVRDCDFRQAVEYLAGGSNVALTRHFSTSVKSEVNFRFASPTPQANWTPASNLTKKRPAAEPKDNGFIERLIADIIRELVPVRRTPGEEYLYSVRKIDTDTIADALERTDAIGWHPSVLFREEGHPLDGKRLGCIVGVMTEAAAAKPTGAISRTYLAPNLAKVGKAKTLGAPAGIVRLSVDEDVLEGLHLAEGLETALAGMSIGLRPMWATGSTAPMSKFPVLPGIECLNLIVDHDPNGAGEKAGREAEARWRSAGKEVRLLRSNAPGDLNDVLREGAK